ncbi:sulfurtransferase [Geosporobacter ferrireducens]|uniref:thiosulfate sulfurtransferase n=1 Tax=Geosporobacter ferrireducens TaxID=1424294 RepID=A0A1D8GES8_9FIRM|nr:sulfurtransferase [Geosporobacter ferrireducens]AOT69414.1 rhodanese [Geosporobacter ferrireducens]
MKRMVRSIFIILIATLMLLTIGCTSTKVEGSGQNIIEAGNVSALLNENHAVLVDMQSAEEYATAHIKGAVNIKREDITINVPVSNMLVSKTKIEDLLGKSGIGNDTTVIIYDNTNNMDAARLWWTLKVYGHENVKVVSGGYKALKNAGLEVTSDVPGIMETTYAAKDKNTDMIATIEDVKAQVNDPSKDVVLLDTRTEEEFNEGTIPGSILLDYIQNNYKDGTYKSIENIKIQYIEKGITPEKTTILYCKTSIRGAQTYLALYNAGYRNLKLYDGAWVEWSANPSLPVQRPEGLKVESNQQDNS